jgi:hypothetical protein
MSAAGSPGELLVRELAGSCGCREHEYDLLRAFLDHADLEAARDLDAELCADRGSGVLEELPAKGFVALSALDHPLRVGGLHPGSTVYGRVGAK